MKYRTSGVVPGFGSGSTAVAIRVPFREGYKIRLTTEDDVQAELVASFANTQAFIISYKGPESQFRIRWEVSGYVAE